jgi:2,6-dihydroxypyridine 3-monooxygenase
LGGLTAALVLRDLGCEVDVYERSTNELQGRGVGIVVLDETTRYLRERTAIDLDDVTVRTSRLRYLDADGDVAYEAPRTYRYSGWQTIYRALLGAFPPDRYHFGAEVAGFREVDGGVDIELANGDGGRVELLVCADGIASTSRRRLLPEVRPVYAGYVAWRGTVEEARLPASVTRAFDDAIVYQVIPAGHILVYPIPNADGDTTPGRRLLNFVWYRNYADDELDELMTDRAGVRHERTLPPGSVADEHVHEMRAYASATLAPPLAELVRATDAPFVQAVFDIEVPRMAFGRVCLLGDAAFVVRPHIAAGTAKAAADGWALAEALETADGRVVEALRAWERRQLEVGRAALDRARRNGIRSQFEGTWIPGEPSLAFGLAAPLP